MEKYLLSIQRVREKRRNGENPQFCGDGHRASPMRGDLPSLGPTSVTTRRRHSDRLKRRDKPPPHLSRTATACLPLPHAPASLSCCPPRTPASDPRAPVQGAADDDLDLGLARRARHRRRRVGGRGASVLAVLGAPSASPQPRPPTPRKHLWIRQDVAARPSLVSHDVCDMILMPSLGTTANTISGPVRHLVGFRSHLCLISHRLASLRFCQGVRACKSMGSGVRHDRPIQREALVGTHLVVPRMRRPCA